MDRWYGKMLYYLRAYFVSLFIATIVQESLDLVNCGPSIKSQLDYTIYPFIYRYIFNWPLLLRKGLCQVLPYVPFFLHLDPASLVYYIHVILLPFSGPTSAASSILLMYIFLFHFYPQNLTTQFNL